jgi:hypothetical protein
MGKSSIAIPNRVPAAAISLGDSGSTVFPAISDPMKPLFKQLSSRCTIPVTHISILADRGSDVSVLYPGVMFRGQ